MNSTNPLITESGNQASATIDTLPTLQMLEVINNEDAKVAQAVKAVLPQIAQAVDAIATAFSRQGRLIYLGAGTSGRLGVLDASECPPTFGTSPEQVIALIAGGKQAILSAVENAEDDNLQAKKELQHLALSQSDVVVGIAASGRTPYVIGAMEYAKQLGATVIALCCNPNSPMEGLADIAIVPIVGAEVVTGSSRLKAGSAQKLVLNMLTTGAMIKSGKVLGNLMVDVQASNEKLRQRQVEIVMQATGVSADEAKTALNEANQQCKIAIFMLLTGCSAEQSKEKLEKHAGFIRKALDEMT